MEASSNKNKRVLYYFICSATQHNLRETIDASIGKVFIPGEVLVNGQWKKYTQLSTSPNSTYSDAIIITKGYLDKIRYKDPSRIWRAENV